MSYHTFNFTNFENYSSAHTKTIENLEDYKQDKNFIYEPLPEVKYIPPEKKEKYIPHTPRAPRRQKTQHRAHNNTNMSKKEEFSYKDKGVSMKIETLRVNNLANPNVWGPAMWFSLHNGAIHYPNKASPQVKEGMKGFIRGIPYMLPCKSCSIHATNYIKSNMSRMDVIVSGREQLFNFFVDFHNDVNRRNGKPVLSLSDAKKLYTNGINIQKISYS